MKPPLDAFEAAHSRLANYREHGESARLRAAAHATKVCSYALELEQVGVWLFQNDTLVCITQYQQSRDKHTSGHTLIASQYPAYIHALRQRRIVVAEDAVHDPVTRELADTYLIPNRIGSILDAPIIRNDELIGVVCHEHVGEPRTFSTRDLECVSAVADMLSMIFEQTDRLEVEASLQDQAERRLNHQKMAALGNMATAVAHDFNNVLTTITLSIEPIQEAIPRELHETLRDIDSSIGVARRLIQQLLTFGKRSSRRPQRPISLRASIDSLRPVLKTAVGRRVTLRVTYPTEDVFVLIDTGRLEQILLNLCINSRDAILDEGTIDIVVRLPTSSDDVPTGQFILEVRDNGKGMSEATMQRLFEPFYTTRREGTGLGLATVYGIVQHAGGSIRASSRVGEGTTMCIALPLSDAPAS